MAKILQDRKDVEFIAAGGFVHGNTTPVKFLGYLPKHELVRVYQEAYLAVVPSIWDEPFGFVAVEPMSCAKPVVAYASGGLGEIIEHRVTGLLVPVGNINKLVESVEYLIDNEKEASRMGASARKRVKKYFTLSKMIENYLAIIEKFGKVR